MSGQDETRRSWVKVDDIKRHEVDGSKNESRQSKINSSRRPLFTDSKIKKNSILIWNFSLWDSKLRLTVRLKNNSRNEKNPSTLKQVCDLETADCIPDLELFLLQSDFITARVIKIVTSQTFEKSGKPRTCDTFGEKFEMEKFSKI